MSSAQQEFEAALGMAPIQSAFMKPLWYAIQTRSRHEKKVAAQLSGKGVENFLPLLTQEHRWSDRRKIVELPLFPGYSFVRMIPSVESQLRVLQTGGVVGLLGIEGRPLPIPDKQIEDIRTLLARDVSCQLFPFLRVGQRVRVRGGCLDGIEGFLAAINGDKSLVISLDPIQQSVAFRIEGYEIEVLAPPRSSAA